MARPVPTGIGGGEAVTMHALPVGGGIVVFSAMPGTAGDYPGDLEHLASWRPAMVLSIVSAQELASAAAQTLGQDVQDKGARWVQLPIRQDGTVGAGLQDWAEISAQARRALLGGGRVMLHSLHGGPRCGMVLLRLMIEAGEAPDEALDRLEAICPVALGTPEQLAWALQADRGAVPFVRHPDRKRR